MAQTKHPQKPVDVVGIESEPLTGEEMRMLTITYNKDGKRHSFKTKAGKPYRVDDEEHVDFPGGVAFWCDNEQPGWALIHLTDKVFAEKLGAQHYLKG